MNASPGPAVDRLGTKVRVRVVSPGPVDTGMTTNPPTVAPADAERHEQAAVAGAMAPAILDAFASGRARRELALRVKVARWLSALGAEPFDTLLKRK